jgi:glycosyltransferase involved in cell wall biosynthesis
LRLTVVTETHDPEVNGVANTLRHLISGLRQRGHQVQVVRPRQATDGAADRRRDEILVLGLPIPRYPGLRFGLPVYWRLRRLWRRQPPDLLYIATEGPLGHAALSAARASAIPAMTGFHTQFHEYSRHYGLGWLMAPIARLLQRFHNRSDATLVPTAALCGRLTAQGFANVGVFGRGVDTVLFSPARRRTDLRARWGCGPDDPVLLYVGRLAAEKNIGLALQAFARAQEAVPGARCVVVGDGPALPKLRRAYPQFSFCGAVTGIALAEHYASADLFVFPSRTETFGNVVLEAMASALVVVALDDAAAHAFIRSGHNGITTDKADERAFVAAVVGASGTLDRLHGLRLAARASAEALGWDRAIDAFEACMCEVLHRRLETPGRTHPASAARHAGYPER